jgi:lysophospholipase L1-like esterase
MVMGDSMADWLGYGLEEAFADSPEIGVVRKSKARSGLIRYEARSDLDWWHVARDLLGKEKVDYVVMMLGVDDRTSIRESQVEKKKAEAAKEAASKEAKPEQDAKTDAKPEDDETPTIAAPEPKRGASGVIEFRTERWEQIYTKRIDETIAALKSKGIPVLWVGLPSIRGTRSTADAVYLNDLFRARAEQAGIVYVDIWDGFVDEGGKFTYMGPDFEGQNRRLRSGDGVHFTKNGARKLAHYVERELRRFMSNRALPMAMPSGAPELQNAPNEPAARPVAGPVQALTGVASTGNELLGGGGTRPVHSDPVATRVLVKGEPVAAAPGRADDFKWPRGGGDAATAEPLTPTAAAARAEPAASRKPEPKKDAKQAAREPAKDAAKREPAAANKPKPAAPAAATKPPAATDSQPRPRAPVQHQTQQRREPGLFGLFR